MFIIQYKNFFFWLSGVLVVLSLGAMVFYGLPFGIDFTGGVLIEVTFEERPSVQEIQDALTLSEFDNAVVQQTGERGVIVRTQDIGEGGRERLVGALEALGTFTEERFTQIGPVIGSELARRAVVALSLVVILIILFITYVFRKVSYPVASWKYGVVAIVALVHDIIIPTGVFIVVSQFTGGQIDALFVTALLAILGLSVNDTIVVFDRIRENLRLKIGKEFSETVGISLRQTIARSINTSLTTLFVLGALFFAGPESTRDFALVLAVGLIAGTYSSIFLASPLLVVFAQKRG